MERRTIERAREIRERLFLMIAPALAALLSGCSSTSILSPRGPVAAANKTIMLNSLAIMLAIVIPTLVALAGIAWWFRASNPRAERDEGFVFSGRIEAVAWGIPLLTIIFLGGLIWMGSHRLDPYRRLAPTGNLEVQVVSLDWKWLFIYPEQGVASVNRLLIPAGRPVHFSLTSSSVMNTFFVPQLGSQIYTMNGMVTQLSLRADAPGRFRGQSSHYSGDGFSGMGFAVDAVPPGQFDAWVAQARSAPAVLDARTYPRLAKQSSDVRPFAIGRVQPRLFDAIVAQHLPPAAGPKEGRGGDPEVSPQ